KCVVTPRHIDRFFIITLPVIRESAHNKRLTRPFCIRVLSINRLKLFRSFSQTTRFQISQAFIIKLVGWVKRFDILAQIDIVVFASASGKGHKNGDSTAKQRNFRIYREFRTRHADSGHLAAFSLSGSACNFKINAFTLLQYISISVKVNIAEIVLILHKPYAGKIGNRLTNQSAEFASYKKVGNKIPYF